MSSPKNVTSASRSQRCPPSRNDVSPVSSCTSASRGVGEGLIRLPSTPRRDPVRGGRWLAIHDDVAVVDHPQEQQSVVGIEQHHSAAVALDAWGPSSQVMTGA